MKRLFGSLLVFCLAAALASAGRVSAQKEKTVRRYDTIVEIGSYVRIPEATEPCSAEESEWWTQIRNAHAEILVGYKKRKEKAIAQAKAKFFLLLHEGQLKSYRVPLRDRPPVLLVSGRPQYTYLAQEHKTKGTVELSVEFQANGSVGDIEIIKRLEDGLTESAIEATRQNVFLPAIRDRAFVAERRNVKATFSRGSADLLDWKRPN